MSLAGWPIALSLLLCVSPMACYGKGTKLQHKRALMDMNVVNDNLGGYNLFNMTVPQVQGYLPVDAPCDKPSDMQDDSRLYQYMIYTRDCGQPWRLCLSERSKVSLQQAIQSIIGTAVGIRRYVDTYYFIERTWDSNLDNGESIQITARDIWSYGVNDYPHFNAMASQIAFRDLAGSSDWQQAVDSDSCVVSPESKMSYERAFGQAAMVRIFQLYNGFLPQIRDWSCMKHQLGFLAGYINASVKGNTCGIPGDGGKALKSIGPTSTAPFTSGFFGQSLYPTVDITPGVVSPASGRMVELLSDFVSLHQTPSATVFNRLDAAPDEPTPKSADPAPQSTDSPDTPDTPDDQGDEQPTTPPPTPTPSPSPSASKSAGKAKESKSDNGSQSRSSPSATKTRSPSQTADASAEETSSAADDDTASQSSEAHGDILSEAGHTTSNFFDGGPASTSASGAEAAGSAEGGSAPNGPTQPGTGPAATNKEPSMYTTIVGNYDLGDDSSLYSGALSRTECANSVYFYSVIIGVLLGVLL